MKRQLSLLLSFFLLLIVTISPIATSAAPTTNAANHDAKAPPTETALTPIPFDAQYDISLNGSSQLTGSRQLSVSEDGVYTLEYKAKHFLFEVRELSRFKWNNHKLIPLYYRSERSHLFGSSHKDVHFDWPNNTAKFYYKKKKGQFELEPDAIDPLSTLFVISSKIQQGLTNIIIRETEDNDIESRKYTVDGQETLITPLGPLKTIKATLHDKEVISVWLAVELNYLAVKLRHKSKDGNIYELNLRQYEGPQIKRSYPISSSNQKLANNKTSDDTIPDHIEQPHLPD